MLIQKYSFKKQKDLSLKNSIKSTSNHQKNNQFKQFQDKINKLKHILQKDSFKDTFQIQNNKFNPISKNKLSNGSIISIANRQKFMNKGKNKQKVKQPQYKRLRFDSIQRQQNCQSNQFHKRNKIKEKQLKHRNQINDFEQKKKRLYKYQLHKTILSDQLLTNNNSKHQYDSSEFYKNAIIQQQNHLNSPNSQQIPKYMHQTLNQDLKYQMSKLKSIFKSKQNALNKQNQHINNIESSINISKHHETLFKNITLTEPYEYSAYKNLMKKQQKRNNASSLSNMSNFQNYYLKSVYEQKVSSVIKNNKSKNKSQYDYQKNLSSKNKGLSSSLLLSRRRNNNFSSKLIKFNSSSNNHKKSKNNNRESSSKQIINLSTVINSKENININYKSNNKSKNSKKNTRNSIEKYTKINFSNSIQKLQRNSMGSLSFIYENKNPQSQNKQIFINKAISTIRSNSVDSLYNNNSFKKSKKIFQLQARYSNNNQEQKEIQKKNLRRKYQIQQLTLRLKCQLKKINSAISKSAVISKKSSNNSSTKKITNKKNNKKYTENKNYILQNLQETEFFDGNSIGRDCLNSNQKVKDNGMNFTKKQFRNQQRKQQKRLFQSDNNVSLQIKELYQLHKNSQSPQKIEIIFIKQNQFQSPQLIKQQKSQKKVKINQFIEIKKQQNQLNYFIKSSDSYIQNAFNEIMTVIQNDSQINNQQHFGRVQISCSNKEVKENIQLSKNTQNNAKIIIKNKNITQKFDSKFIQKNTKKLTNLNDICNSQFQKFILIYAELLIIFASKQDSSNDQLIDDTMHQNNKNDKLTAKIKVKQCSLIKRLKKPLGISSIKLLQMMRQNYNKDQEQNSQKLNNSDNKDYIDHNQSLLISEEDSHSNQCLKQEKHIKRQQENQKYAEGQQNNQQSTQILSSEVYFNLNSYIHKILDQNSTVNINIQSGQEISRFQQTSKIFQFVKVINSLYQKYNKRLFVQLGKGNSDEYNVVNNMSQYYQNYLNQLSIAIFDSVNLIIDKLRPFGTKGLPPIHFYNQNTQSQLLCLNQHQSLHIHNPKILNLSQIIEFTKATLKQNILQVKLGLLLQQFTLDNSKQIQQIIKKKLQKQSQLISKQLDQEYSYLQDVKFQIFYDIQTILEQEILSEEVKEIQKLIFK